MSELYQSLSHSKWGCKYHVVLVPKRRRKIIFGQTRRQLGTIFHSRARQKECQILEGHLMPDHVHMCIAIPPQHPVASVIGLSVAAKWSPARGAVRSEPFPLLRSVVRNGPEPSRARRCWARRSEPLTARTVLR